MRERTWLSVFEQRHNSRLNILANWFLQVRLFETIEHRLLFNHVVAHQFLYEFRVLWPLRNDF